MKGPKRFTFEGKARSQSRIRASHGTVVDVLGGGWGLCGRVCRILCGAASWVRGWTSAWAFCYVSMSLRLTSGSCSESLDCCLW